MLHLGVPLLQLLHQHPGFGYNTFMLLTCSRGTDMRLLNCALRLPALLLCQSC
jgi:hypothetical protein